MPRSWSPRSRPSRRPVSLTVIAAVAALGAGSTAAAAASPTATTAKRCAQVAGATSGSTWSQVQIVNVRGISCGAARNVVRRCLARDAVRGWTRSGRTAAPGLRDGRRRIKLKVLTDDEPTCVEHGPVGVGVGVGAGLGAGALRGAGPFEGPFQMPPTSRVKWQWTQPIASRAATAIEVGSATLSGQARTSDDTVRSVWFEYGKTRDLARGTKTAAQAPKTVADDAPWSFDQPIKGLDAKTRYFWRAAANLDNGTSEGRTIYGATGSFVTEGYRKMSGANPCSQAVFGGNEGGITQVTESLTVVCSPRWELVNKTYLPISVGYSGRLTCPRDYAHNLNAGNVEINIPKIDYKVKFNNLVNYWRSNDSARFTTFPGYQQHYEGAEQGPLVGWHEWNIDEWGSLGSTNSTLVQLWINCTDNWQAFSTEQLARGEGDDQPSTSAPPTPDDFRFVRVDGGWRGSWDAVRNVTGGVAGYQLQVNSVRDGSPAGVLVTDLGTTGTISDAYVKAMVDIYRTRTLYAHVWAISGEGVRSTRSAVIPITAP
ncbi:MAG TPA: hypothetical protein VK506_01430 [Conexibacter sp.]|nr:hypothetical protein [Conexibacter sp.]